MTHKKTAIILFLIIAIVIAGVFGIRFYNSYRFHVEKDTRLMMDTFVTIYAVGPEKNTSRAMTLAFERMEAVDAKFSIHNPESPLYAFNHQGTPVSDLEILEVVRFALNICHQTEGAFDITIAPLIELWGFYTDTPRVPADDAIKACLNIIGYQHLVLENGKLEKLMPDVRIDLGAIAKGYSVREAAEVLKANGVTSALIDAGGDVYAMGSKGNALWKVGLRSPRSEELLGYVEVEDLAVMGSGDYERFFTKDGKRYHHIFDPRTGYPCPGLSSVHLFHPDPMTADAWCTALFVLGKENGFKITEKTPDMETIMITASGEVLFSSGLKNQLKHMSKNND